jgi:hypothetical protein
MTAPIGPPFVPEDPTFRLARCNVAVTIGAPDIAASSLFVCGSFTKIRVNDVGGTLYLQGAGDAALVPFIVVPFQVL